LDRFGIANQANPDDILHYAIKSSRKLTIISNERKFFGEPDALKNKSSGRNVKLKYSSYRLQASDNLFSSIFVVASQLFF